MLFRPVMMNYERCKYITGGTSGTRVVRYKQFRRTLQFFRLVYGIKPPYKVGKGVARARAGSVGAPAAQCHTLGGWCRWLWTPHS